MDYLESFRNAYQLYITNKETKITRLNKIFYSHFELLIGDKNCPEYKRREEYLIDIEEGVYRHNGNYYFSFSKAKLQKLVKNIGKYRYIINSLDPQNKITKFNEFN